MSRPAWIFRSRCLPAILTAASRCWQRMSCIRLCPPARSKSSSVSLPTSWQENFKARPTLGNTLWQSALLPKNDPDLRHATSKSISSLSLADVRNYYKRVFQPDLTTIVIVGNITPERARYVIERNFGSWKSHGPRPRTLLPPVPTNQPSSTEVPNASREQAEVTLAETLPVNRSDPDYYALNLGSQVLGGAFYASRLSRDLRENTGLVYDVSSTLDADPTRRLLHP